MNTPASHTYCCPDIMGFRLCVADHALPSDLGIYLIQGENLIKRLRLDRGRLINFLSAIEAAYQQSSYHNAYHACEVLQYTHMLLCSGGVKDACWLDAACFHTCTNACSCSLHCYL